MTPEPMACFRLHVAADSSRLVATGENVIEERRSIECSCGELPPEYAPLVRRAAMRAARRPGASPCTSIVGRMISAPQPGVSLSRACAAVLHLQYWLARVLLIADGCALTAGNGKPTTGLCGTAAGWAVVMWAEYSTALSQIFWTPSGLCQRVRRHVRSSNELR